MTHDDSQAVLRIYQEGIDTGHATFESKLPSWQDFISGKLDCPRLVAEQEGAVCAWATLSAVSSRHVYRGVAEVTIYVAAEARGQGLGGRLLQALCEASEREGFWTLQALIFVENAASIAMHERCGFTSLGVRKRLGLMAHGPMRGQWRDIAMMERRSEAVGLSPRSLPSR